jgi:hypothetical protein
MKKEGVSPAGGGEGVVSICRYRMKAYKKAILSGIKIRGD